jgi:hypothetical protein
MKKGLPLLLIAMLAVVAPIRAELLQIDLSIFGMD